MNKISRVAGAAVAAAAVLMPAVAAAEDGFAFNVGGVTDYRYRGLSQSRLKPALQGGADFSKGGFYVGAWASTIKWIEDSGGDGNVEIDLYGGYKGSINQDLSFDVGVLRYQYPSNALAVSANTNEIYGAITFGPVTAKYSHAVSNLFGNADSEGSGYVDLTASFEWEGITLAPHIGYQSIESHDDLSYTDYSFTVSKTFKGVVLSAAIVGTDLDFDLGGKNIGKPGLVLGAKYNF